jgi:hypothetical protein
MEIDSPLLVELLCGNEVERFPRHAAAQPFLRDVTQRLIVPGIRNGKKYRAVTPHEHILLALRLRFCSWRRGSRVTMPHSPRGFLRLRFDSFFRLRFVRGSLLDDRAGRKKKSSIKKWEEAGAQTIAAVTPPASRGSEVNFVKAQPGRTVKVLGKTCVVVKVCGPAHRIVGSVNRSNGCSPASRMRRDNSCRRAGPCGSSQCCRRPDVSSGRNGNGSRPRNGHSHTHPTVVLCERERRKYRK